jgi:Cd2+/Zn2+-exporting ATPase
MGKVWRDPQVWLTVGCGLFLVANLAGAPVWTAYLSVALGSYFALASAWESLIKHEIDVNLLMVLAAAGAVLVGQPLEAAALLFLFSLSSTLESLTMARTKSAIEALIRLRPDSALRIENDQDVRVPLQELRVGDLIRVSPFEPVPVDSVVERGEGSIDQSAMTGESIPVSKKPGDPLLGGTRNLDRGLIARVSVEVGDNTLDRIVALVDEAQTNKASGERISQWFGERYTIFVLAVFAISVVTRVVLGSTWMGALAQSLTLLVALSPCALVISTPASTLSALAFAARKGVLVRGGEFIERAGWIDTVAMDKTGTLTTGKPKLAEICLCDPVEVSVPGTCIDKGQCWHDGATLMSKEAESVLIASAALEQYSNHPIGLAVLQAAREHNLSVPEAERLQVEPGRGLVGNVGGVRVVVGRADYLESLGIQIPSGFLDHVAELERSGMPMAIVSMGDKIAGLGFNDAIRDEAKTAIADMKAAGVKNVVMLTGDTVSTATRVAENLGLTDFRAGLLPGDKATAVQDLVTGGGKVMMVGDGVNDAPALSASHVGVAMGGVGSDIAMQSADVILMHDKLARVPMLIGLGKRTNRVIKTNLIFAASVIVVLTVLSLFAKLPLPLAVVGHEGSTVLVILNGLRLLAEPRHH